MVRKQHSTNSKPGLMPKPAGHRQADNHSQSLDPAKLRCFSSNPEPPKQNFTQGRKTKTKTKNFTQGSFPYNSTVNDIQLKGLSFICL